MSNIHVSNIRCSLLFPKLHTLIVLVLQIPGVYYIKDMMSKNLVQSFNALHVKAALCKTRSATTKTIVIAGMIGRVGDEGMSNNW